MYKAVLFDMDGVLIDARDWHFDALNDALRPFDYQISLTDHQERFNGLSTRVKLEILSEEYLPEGTQIHAMVDGAIAKAVSDLVAK